MATARDSPQLHVPLKDTEDTGEQNREQLLQYIEKGQVGYEATLQGPYGTRKGVCTCTSGIILTEFSFCMPNIVSTLPFTFDTFYNIIMHMVYMVPFICQ